MAQVLNSGNLTAQLARDAAANLAATGVTADAAEVNKLDGLGATAAEIDIAADQSANFVSVTDAASYTVLAANSGKVHLLPDFTATCTLAMPAEAAGLRYRFVYAGRVADAQNFVLDTGSDLNYFLGGVAWHDMDAGAGADELVLVSPDGNSNSKLTVVVPQPGTCIEVICTDGVTWTLIASTVHSATTPAFADQ